MCRGGVYPCLALGGACAKSRGRPRQGPFFLVPRGLSLSFGVMDTNSAGCPLHPYVGNGQAARFCEGRIFIGRGFCPAQGIMRLRSRPGKRRSPLFSSGSGGVFFGVWASSRGFPASSEGPGRIRRRARNSRWFACPIFWGAWAFSLFHPGFPLNGVLSYLPVLFFQAAFSGAVFFPCPFLSPARACPAWVFGPLGWGPPYLP